MILKGSFQPSSGWGSVAMPCVLQWWPTRLRAGFPGRDYSVENKKYCNADRLDLLQILTSPSAGISLLADYATPQVV